MIAPGETAKVINKGKEPITIGWDNIQYILQPNKSVLVPAEAAMNAFGDPRSESDMKSVTLPNQSVAWVPDRASEVRRLRSYWGNHDGPEDSIVGPDVEVYTVLDERVYTVIDDPSGNNVQAAVRSESSQQTLEALVARQQKQLDALMMQMKNPDQAGKESDIPADDGGISIKPPIRDKGTPENIEDLPKMEVSNG